MSERPIANKYREGKMKRTLKRELKVLEIVRREAIGAGVRHSRPFRSFQLVRVQALAGALGSERCAASISSALRGG